jgi:hypothetical protein
VARSFLASPVPLLLCINTVKQMKRAMSPQRRRATKHRGFSVRWACRPFVSNHLLLYSNRLLETSFGSSEDMSSQRGNKTA